MTTRIESAADRILQPQPCTGHMLWHWDFLPDSDPGWQGLYWVDLLVGEVYPHPKRPGRWCWVVWIGETDGGEVASMQEARAYLWRELDRRPASECEVAS